MTHAAVTVLDPSFVALGAVVGGFVKMPAGLVGMQDIKVTP